MNDIESLECVYYPGPIPCDSAVLTALCFVFDKIHFPGAYLPKGDYDKEQLRQEIARFESLEKKPGDGTDFLIGMLKFLEYRAALDGILEYPSSRDSILPDEGRPPAKLARLIYDANYPPRENFEPIFDTASVKGLPGGDEAIVYRGTFYYQAGAITYAAEHQLPLLDDGSGLALPFRARFKDNAQALSTILALECMGVILPALPELTTQELVDFRAENQKELRSFRAAMLRYAKALNAQISDDPSLEELNQKTKFFIETEINPALYELQRDLMNPNRPWYRRLADGTRIVVAVGLGYATGGFLGKTIADGLTALASSELEARAEKVAAKRNGLYYLLKARTIKA